MSDAVRKLYNKVTCITKDFGGPKDFFIKAFDCNAFVMLPLSVSMSCVLRTVRAIGTEEIK